MCGICESDVECCDGSDELDLKTGVSRCPNVCKEAADKAWEQKREAVAAERKVCFSWIETYNY